MVSVNVFCVPYMLTSAYKKMKFPEFRSNMSRKDTFSDILEIPAITPKSDILRVICRFLGLLEEIPFTEHSYCGIFLLEPFFRFVHPVSKTWFLIFCYPEIAKVAFPNFALGFERWFFLPRTFFRIWPLNEVYHPKFSKNHVPPTRSAPITLLLMVPCQKLLP